MMVNLFLQNTAVEQAVVAVKEQAATAGVEPINALIAAGVALAAGVVIYVVRHGGIG